MYFGFMWVKKLAFVGMLERHLVRRANKTNPTLFKNPLTVLLTNAGNSRVDVLSFKTAGRQPLLLPAEGVEGHAALR